MMHTFKRLLLLCGLLPVLFSAVSCQSAKPAATTAAKVQREGIRGVWLTNVASDALYSKEKIQQTVDLCDELGINTIMVVTLNKAMTTYRSQVMKQMTGVEIDPVLDPQQTGRDPLQELIEAAHAKHIKVIAWFEFGFSSSHSANGGPLVKKNPHWASLDSDGKLTVKNGFDWMNALDPEVQNFLTSLVLEVVEKYDVDGIQGDDRLPAMPSKGGYNPNVIEAYKQEHGGQAPPTYYKDFEWVNWRAERLNQYMEQLYHAVKAKKPGVIVSMAPSVFPWAKEEYLQDWPTWINRGYVDLLCPQLYRKNQQAYDKALQDAISYIDPALRHKMSPGVLIKVGEEYPSQELFNGMLEANRKAGYLGETYFFYEGIKKFKSEMKQAYQERVAFPAYLERAALEAAYKAKAQQ